MNELMVHHSALYIPDITGAPATLPTAPSPMLLSSGWDDDLFPVSQTVMYYNKIRTQDPGTPISLYLLDFGHARSQNKAADLAQIATRENAWFNYYVKGVGSPPQQGVDALTTTCPSSAASAGPIHAASWADLSNGEIRFSDPSTKTITLLTAASNGSTFGAASGGPCGTSSATDLSGIASYRLDPAPAPGYTILGSPTFTADITTPDGNNTLAARLFDVNTSTNTETLIARGVYRPAVGASPVNQVFQLHPQAWHVDPGHVVKLELENNDSPYARIATGQTAETVSNLQLRDPDAGAPPAPSRAWSSSRCRRCSRAGTRSPPTSTRRPTAPDRAGRPTTRARPSPSAATRSRRPSSAASTPPTRRTGRPAPRRSPSPC